MTTINFHEALRQRFVDVTPHVAECGMQITDISAAGATVILPVREDWIGDLQRQVIHTGVIATLVDSACGAAVLGAMDAYEPIATIDLRLDYLRAARRDLTLHCRAECHRLTASVAFARATVWQESPDQPVAVSQGAFMRSSARRPASGSKA